MLSYLMMFQCKFWTLYWWEWVCWGSVSHMVYPLVVLLTISSCNYSCCSCTPAPQPPLPVSFVACSSWINVVLLCSCSSGAALGDYPCVWVAYRTAPAAALCSVILWLPVAVTAALVLLLQSTNITDVHLPLLMLSSSPYESDAIYACHKSTTLSKAHSSPLVPYAHWYLPASTAPIVGRW